MGMRTFRTIKELENQPDKTEILNQIRLELEEVKKDTQKTLSFIKKLEKIFSP